ncbi:uracil-DNA glycosylase family protein [Salinimonas iocasae]|uniref:Uracil-DNA glycosylase family protein n=1 Tax=Salinimonas iocasae TaxID=2572577 RepID=A0A5B7YA69_9ALTE|nr:uracil-DNA glycosylase family protein [Salinimonas iocasae]QCZ92542.1 uracil-DNA glycosylase family protein [Salinimonas iocasae]
MKYEKESFDALMNRVRACTLCEAALPQAPRPVLAASEHSRIVIIGQAPGILAHDSATPWNDRSGDRLRRWMGIDTNTFYNEKLISLIPMGFCFPGYKNGADAPPRKECAPAWHHQLLSRINPSLTVLVGRYAQQFYCPKYKTLTEAVQSEAHASQSIIITPHPSGRNNRWLGKNPWFESSLVPALQQRVQALLEN